MRPALLASFILGLCLLLSACDSRTQAVAVRLSGATMGTSYHITLVHSQAQQQITTLQTAIDQLLEEINQSMSTYVEDSEINRLARTPVGIWTPVSTELLQVLVLSRGVSELSSGAFDITVRPLIDLWGFGPDVRRDAVPDQAEISRLRALTGYQNLLLDESARKVQRTADISLDLSAVAKGYAVDRVAGLLESRGFQNLLVEIGGELALRGHNANGQGWRIAVERPQAGMAGEVYKTLQLTDVGVATSGDYRNYFELDGKRYSHTIDPRTGYPVRHNLVSVTVVAESAARADALATAFSVMGVDQALRLANSEGVAALFIIQAGEKIVEKASEAFQLYL